MSDTDERYTPPELLDLALELFADGITLDAAADPGHRVPALLHYTKADDGLARPWCGNVWVNPPFSNIPGWIDKAIAEAVSGRVDVLMLLMGVTGDKWFRTLRDWPVCFRTGRVGFLRPDGTRMGSPPFGVQFRLFSNDDALRARFFEVFGRVGVCYGRAVNGPAN